MRILHYCNTIDYAGTSRTMERMIKELVKDEEFDIHVLYNESGINNRLEQMKSIVGHNTKSCNKLCSSNSLSRSKLIN